MSPGSSRGLAIATIYAAMALLFIPLVALMPGGARTCLPVYFFTLTAYCRHGW
ncbi:MAG: hypothetical protein UH625_10115 [Muribaculaceae bacterium]|nr:hypothetical protein [Muribaculaceae bacterium]